MAINTDKNVYTVLFATGMVVVVGSILAFLASALKPRIQENERFEKQQNILYAMGVNENEDEGSVNFISTEEVRRSSRSTLPGSSSSRATPLPKTMKPT